MLDRDTLRNQQITRRTFVIGAGKLGLLFILACRLFYMQFIKKDEYKTLSDKNRIRIILIPPIRGQILDKNGEIIARNQTNFSLLLEKGGNPGYMKEITKMTELFELDDDQIKEVNKKVKRAGYKVPAIVIDLLEWEKVSILEEHKSEFKSLFVDIGSNRHYPKKDSCAHLLGHLGRDDNKINEVSEYFKVGKNGIEKFYEELLRGEFGHKKLEVNAHGRSVRSISTSESKPGEDLKLNIDSNIQQKVQNILSKQGCSAVVMDCTNGDILCFNSSPSYNPNEFVKLSQKYWDSLMTNPYNPLINKITQSLYPPGSIFKIVVILAALKYGHNPEEKIFCSGGPVLGGNSFRCAKRTGHGSINLSEAIKGSCNTYIYELAKKIGPDNIINMARMLGLGQITGVDMPNEKAGFVPDREWKFKQTGDKWRLGDTLNLAIGQGFTLITPLQLVRIMAAIASNGKLFTPNIAKRESKYIQLDIKEQHLDLMKAAMYRVMNEPGGTGYYSRINIDGMRMAGKTGTAQVQAKKNASDNLSRMDIAWHRRNHAIFSGFAPFDNPKYAISIYFDHGGGGGTSAAPVAKQIMEMMLKMQV